jgi:hypothetical protein
MPKLEETPAIGFVSLLCEDRLKVTAKITERTILGYDYFRLKITSRAADLEWAMNTTIIFFAAPPIL